MSLFQPTQDALPYLNQAEILIQQIFDASTQVEVINNNQKQIAEFQSSPMAWCLPWKLLDLNKNSQLQHFGASILQNKIKRNWTQLSSEDYEPLKQELINLIKRFRNNKMVCNRLCVALGFFILQATPAIWTDCIFDLVAAFPLNSSENTIILLRLLTICREELKRGGIAKNRLTEVSGYFTQKIEWLFNLIHEILNSNAELSLKCEALKCFSVWVTFCPSSSYSMLIELSKSIFQFFQEEETFSDAVDAIEAVLGLPDIDRYEKGLQEILIKINLLQSLFLNLANQEETDRCLGICRVVVAYANNNNSILLPFDADESGTSNACYNVLQLLQFLLLCAQYPVHMIEEEVSRNTLEVWYNIIETFRPMKTFPAAVIPILLQLQQAIVTKLKFPNDVDFEAWTTDDLSTFKKIRTQYGDTISYVYLALNEKSLRELLFRFNTALQTKNEWQEIHSLLYCFRSLADSYEVKPENNNDIGSLISAIINLPSDTNNYIQYEALLVLASFSLWVEENPGTIGNIMEFVMQRLVSNVTILASAAAVALNDLADNCSELLLPMIEPLVDACTSALYSGKLKVKECRLVTNSVVQVLHHIPISNVSDYIMRLSLPAIEYLKTTVDISNPTPQIEQNLLTHFHIVKSVCENYRPFIFPTNNQNTPMINLSSELCPILNYYLNTVWVSNTEILVAICKTVQGLLNSMNIQFAPFISDLMASTIACYKLKPNYPILEMYSVLFCIFKQQNYTNDLVGIFTEVSELTFSFLQTDIRIDPQLTEYYFKFISEIMKKGNSDVIYMAGAVDIVLDLCLATLECPETNTFKASCNCLRDILKQSNSREEQIQHGIKNRYPQIITTLLKCIIETAPKSVLLSISNVFLEMHVTELGKSLRTLLQQLTPVHVNNASKELLIKKILVERKSRTDLRKVLTEFSCACRNVEGTF